MTQPKALQKGDKVCILATARKISLEELNEGVSLLKSWGLLPVFGRTIGLSHHQFAGTDWERTQDLQAALDNPEIKAIWCARGGYGTVRIIDYLNFDQFIINPKWVIGFSDVTVLHSHIHSLGVQTIHATMPVSLSSNTQKAKDTLQQALFGKSPDLSIDTPNSLNIPGIASGVLVGGNLSILYSLCGSSSSLNTKDKILILEDLDEYLYHIDRMITNLKRNGMLNSLKGLIIGGMTKMHDNKVPYGETAPQIIFNAVKDCNYPVVFDAPTGHISNNCALIMGKTINLNVTKTSATLTYS